MSDSSSHRRASSARLGPTGVPAGEGGSRSGGSSALPGDRERTVISSRQPVPRVDTGPGLPPLESGSLQEGDQLGQFVLQKFIGGGGMGIVFRALDTTLNREVAVKVLSRDQSADEEALRRFHNEAQSAARLNHDNIARVHYVGEDRGVHYIVFEFIEGVNLRDLVEQNGPLPLEQAISYTYQIAQALDHASQRSVIHRDIKPSNVLITSDGRAKLVDMGLARLNQMAHTDDLTASGVTLGTFDYISPEQARDPRSADVRSDLYSLGCSFYYILTGRPPFPDGTVLQKLLQHQADHPPDPRSVRPELPGAVTRIIARLLAKNPAQRFQQPQELIVELAALGEQLGMQLSSPRAMWVPPPGSPRPALKWERHLPWAVPLGALVLIVLLLDLYWQSGRADLADPAIGRPQAPLKRTEAPTKSDGRPRVAQSPASQKPRTVEPIGEPATPEVEQPAPAAKSPRALPVEPESQQPFETEKPGGAAVLPAETGGGLGPPAGSDGELGPGAVGDADTTIGLSAASVRPEPTDVPTATRPVAGVLVVGDAHEGPHAYSSLQAACSNAKTGDVIELRYNGRRAEKPVSISNIKLTVRAGKQFEPVVVFQPDPADPIRYPSNMVSVAGGQLDVSNVHWELDLPRDASADWTLFELRRAELARFENCSFTLRGQATQPGGTFFAIKAPPGAGAMAMDPGADDDQIVTLDLLNCIARGEGALVRGDELQPFRMNWFNGLVAISQPFLVAAGGPSQPRQLGHVQINLRHVTAMLPAGLAVLTNGDDAPYQLLTEIHCDDSIFATRNAPSLVEQRGANLVDQYLAGLQWSGNRDFFDGFDAFWRIVSTGTQAGVREMKFEDWQNFWRQQSRGQSAGRGAVAWTRLPRTDAPYHSQSPADYTLDRTATKNAALSSASDGGDAGCIAAQLPSLVSDQSGTAEPGTPPRGDTLKGTSLDRDESP